MRRVITIDIETLPASQSPGHSPDPSVRLPGASDDEYLKTALNGDSGRILCVGYADEAPGAAVRSGIFGWDEIRKQFTGDEKATLLGFWQLMRTFRTGVDRIVGHNIFDFDLKFILKRSIIHGVRPTVELSFARYRNQPIFDTMYEWERWSYGPKVSLDRLARSLGLKSSKINGIDGSQIFRLYQSGQHRAIRDYCLGDVLLTRSIYKRMVFEESVPNDPSFPVSIASEARDEVFFQ
ncbi:MAG: ribonuclease H-like domain-containing protein [Blastocatellales bacterium]|nr:ribonuclease H-like domain-containing protein [Blastocatellales bacterium]